jgi:hypothetical protein
MWAHTYTQQHLEQTDTALYSMMRARSVQETLNILIPDDPPRNLEEYEEAYRVFAYRVRSATPFDTAPLTLIGHWARLAALSIAMQGFQDAHGCIVALQEQGCRFADDNIMLVAAKLGFGVAIAFLSMKSQAEELHLTAFSCYKMLVSKDEEWAGTHGTRALELCANLWQLLQDFSMMQSPKTTDLRAVITFLHLGLVSTAKDIDRATRKRFEMLNWVNEMEEQLGYSKHIVR